jgi:hypothetical protein
VAVVISFRRRPVMISATVEASISSTKRPRNQGSICLSDTAYRLAAFPPMPRLGIWFLAHPITASSQDIRVSP